MQKEKKFEKIKKLLHQFKMRKVRFEEITYIKVKNIDDYIDLRNSIEKCFIDKKESSPDSCVKCYTMFLPFLLIKIDVFS